MKITQSRDKGFKAILMFCAISLFTFNMFAQGNNWKLNGNNNVSNSNFLGSTNNNDVIFKANNNEYFRLKAGNSSLKFKNRSVFDDISIFHMDVRLKLLADSTITSIRPLGIANNGDITLLPSNNSPTFDYLSVLNEIKIGTNSLYLGSATPATINNYIYTDNFPLEINGNHGAGTPQNTIINPDGGIVGINTATPDNLKTLHVNGATLIQVDAPGTPDNQNLKLVTTNTNNPCIQLMRNSIINNHIQEGDLAFLDNTGELKGLFRMGLDYNQGYENYFRFYSFHKNQTPDREVLMNVSDNDITMFPYPTVWGGGNVGIGLSNPQATLDVNGTFRLSDGNQGAGKVLVSDQNGYASWTAASSLNDGDWSTFNTSLYKVGGEVFVGEVPNANSFGVQMTVKSDDVDNEVALCVIPQNNTTISWGVKVITDQPNNIGLSVESATYGFAYRVQGNGEVRMLTGMNQNDKPIVITNYNSGDDVFQITEDGHVYATKINVMHAGTFPDYVFADDYELMGLSKLEKYIHENKHLPNMPTAKEVEINGADLGEINKVLVEKVEELTLYVIKLNSEIENLKKQITH